ncbi:MAG: histidine phosphatase family protein [Rhodospirillales bacterium]
MGRGLAALLLSFLAAFPAAAEPSAEAAWAAFARPGTVALMRHAYAPGTGDPQGFRLDDCTTQRNLNDEGRAQAKATGDAIRRRGIHVAQVIASPWCRCKETAELLRFGPVETRPWLMSVHAAPDQEGPRTRELKAFLAALPKDRKTFVVTHQFNIRALVGRPTDSGAMVVVEPTADGGVNYLGSIRVEAK